MSEYGTGDGSKIGTSGVIVQGGLRFAYTDLQLSGAMLNDRGANVPEDKGERYWVRSTVGGMRILGPVLDVIEGVVGNE